MAIEAQDAPPREEYKYVLVKEGKSPDLTWIYTHYFGIEKSIPVNFRGEILPLIFINRKSIMMGAWRRGWRDITPEWVSWIEEITPKPTTDSQEQIINHLKIGSGEIDGNLEYQWYTKSNVLKATGVPETVWRTAIRTLLDRDLIEKTGFGKATKYRLKEWH